MFSLVSLKRHIQWFAVGAICARSRLSKQITALSLKNEHRRGESETMLIVLHQSHGLWCYPNMLRRQINISLIFSPFLLYTSIIQTLALDSMLFDPNVCPLRMCETSKFSGARVLGRYANLRLCANYEVTVKSSEKCICFAGLCV
jgi:hypothetical protein